MPEGKHPWIRIQLPLALAVVLLFLLIIVPLYTQRRIAQLRSITADVAEPARLLVSEVQLSVARGIAGTRGYLLTGDTALIFAHRAGQQRRERAYSELLPLAVRLGPRVHMEVLRMREPIPPADALLDSLYSGQMPIPEYVRRIPDQQARFEAVTASAARINQEIGRVVIANTTRAARIEAISTTIIVILAALSIVAALFIGRLGRNYRLLAARLERRARWRGALNEAARELSAATTLEHVVHTAVQRAVATTRAFGSYIELMDETEPEGDVEVAAVAGSGCPPVHTRVPYPGSLSQKAIDSGEPDILGEISAIGERMAPYLQESCRQCTGLILPLSSENRFVGALVLLRSREQEPFGRDEVGYILSLADLTVAAIRRVRLLEKVTEAETKFRQIANHLREVIWLTSPDSSVRLYINPAFEKIFGRPVQDFYNRQRSPIESVHPDDRGIFEKARAQMRYGEFDVEYRIVRPDGDVRWVWSRGYPIRDEYGNIYRFAGIIEDITEQKQIQREREQLLANVRDTRDKLVDLLESMQEGFYALDNEERFTYVNREAERLLETSRDKMLGHLVWDVYPYLKETEAYPNFRRALHERESAHFVHHDKYLDLWTDVHVYPSAEGISVLFQDITERHRAEEAMRESERNFRAMGNSIPQLAWMTDRDGNVLWFNRRFYEFTGLGPEAMASVYWSKFHHPDHFERVYSTWKNAVRTGEPWEDTFPMRSASGEYRWFLTRAVPIRNEKNEVTRWFGTNTDVTDQMNVAAEREELLRRERHAREEAEQRGAELARVTESRATLMRGFGHDVKNPLGAADGYLQLLEEGIMGPIEHKQLESVGKVRRSIRAALALIEDLLALARAEAGQIDIARTPTDVRLVVREAADEYHAQAESEGLTLDIDTTEHLPLIDSDPRRIRQIIANLLSNAVKYTEHGGVTVSTHVREGGDAPGPGHWIAVDVCDTGPGIREEQREAIFDEFHRARTPSAEPGAGIGLAIARKIARALGGEITLRSQLGAGSTFTLWLKVQ